MADNVCPICGNAAPLQAAACPLCGYRFIDATHKFEAISLEPEPEAAKQDGTDKPANDVLLRVIRGPKTGVSYKIEKTISSVGRSPQCDIFLNDMTVSREHALIAATEKGYVITDRKSYNGLWVNNKLVDSAVLKSGDLIQIGEFCLMFEE